MNEPINLSTLDKDLFIKNLCIGTASFGQNYGIQGKHRVSINEVNKILSIAENSGIDTLDTAYDYGNTHKILGEIGIKNWKINTKLPKINLNSNNIETEILQYVEKILNDLNIQKIESLLVHFPDQLLEAKGEVIYNTLTKLKRTEIVSEIGFSANSVEQLKLLLDKYETDIVQFSLNILDRRIIKSGLLDKLYNLNIKLQIRSIFLQGLLLMTKKEMPNYFRRWDSLWNIWINFHLQNNYNYIETCISFVMKYRKKISKYLIGINNSKELEEIIMSNINPGNIPNNFFSNEEDLINPSIWKL